MKMILAIALAVVTMLSGCAVSGSYSGIQVIPSPQAAAPGTQKVCTTPSIGGSSYNNGQYSSSSTSSVQQCVWVNANGQNCRSTENRVYRAQFGGYGTQVPNNNSSYRWECR